MPPCPPLPPRPPAQVAQEYINRQMMERSDIEKKFHSMKDDLITRLQNACGQRDEARQGVLELQVGGGWGGGQAGRGGWCSVGGVDHRHHRHRQSKPPSTASTSTPTTISTSTLCGGRCTRGGVVWCGGGCTRGGVVWCGGMQVAYCRPP